MSLGSALTEYITTEKMFTWRINNFDAITLKNLEVVEYSEMAHNIFSNEQQEIKMEYHLLKSPTMVATHPSTGVKCNGTIALKFGSAISFPKRASILLESDSTFEKTFFSYKINDGMEECDDVFEIPKHSETPENSDSESDEVSENPQKLLVAKTVTIFANVVTKRCQTFEVTPFKTSSTLGIINRLKKMWENDSSAQFLIKCGNVEIKAIKPLVAASSPVFERMFETEMKEKTDNSVEIIEFKPEIVEKMLEFCESEDIKESKDFEEDLFKIAHKYQMIDFMGFATEKMAESLSTSNIESRLQIANLYGLKEFKNFCMQFIYRDNLEIEF